MDDAEAVGCPDRIFNNCNRVERLWAGLKEWRTIATRYEKTAASFLGVLRDAVAPLDSQAAAAMLSRIAEALR